MFNISVKVLNLVESNENIKIRFYAMKEILETLSKANKPLILKGDSALMFFYQLDRISTDLEFEAMEQTDIYSLLSEKFDVFYSQNTNTIKRYKVNIGLTNPLKIEISLKEKESLQYKNLNGINVYSIDSIFKQKLENIKHKTLAHDLYDIAFILDNYFSKLSIESKEEAKTFLDRLENLIDRCMNCCPNDEFLGEGWFNKTKGRLKEAKKKLDTAKNKNYLKILFINSKKTN